MEPTSKKSPTAKEEHHHKHKYHPEVKSQGNKKIVTIHQHYEIDSEFFFYSTIEQYIQLLNKKEKRKVHQHSHLYETCHFTFFPSFQFLLMKVDASKQICPICQDEFTVHQNPEEQLSRDHDIDIICLGRCSHLFHKHCIQRCVGKQKWLKCPVCSVIYGQMVGDQPEGTMNVATQKGTKIPGYQNSNGAIVINYNMRGGVRNGNNYQGTTRTGYLPNNKEGQKVARLLRTAFDRKLVFTVGRSVTLNRDNMIVWNGIHHKTAIEGGPAYFGYPDPTYLKRVQEELAAKGIYESDSDDD